jgi:two-component system chemotaxis family response regulator WspR
MLDREWQRAIRAQTPFAFLMIDVDEFKTYNDHYGHRAGDRALKTIAACIAAGVTRAEDLAVRYGGEEFAVLLPGTDESGAYRVAETIRRAVAATAIPHISRPRIVTVSVGVAALRPERGAGSGADRGGCRPMTACFRKRALAARYCGVTGGGYAARMSCRSKGSRDV